MTKEDLNRLYGDRKKQNPITPLDLLAAAHLIREHCDDCRECIFLDDDTGCILFKLFPCRWELSIAEHNAADWIDKQYFQGRGLYYTDTDTVK